MSVDLTRRKFVKGSAAVGGGVALSGPLSALAANSAQGASRRAVGYGPLQPAREQESGLEYLELPRGFKYKICLLYTSDAADE